MMKENDLIQSMLEEYITKEGEREKTRNAGHSNAWLNGELLILEKYLEKAGVDLSCQRVCNMIAGTEPVIAFPEPVHQFSLLSQEIRNNEEFVGMQLWQKDDVKEALMNAGYDPTKERVEEVSRMARTSLEDCSDGWDVLESVIHGCGFGDPDLKTKTRKLLVETFEELINGAEDERVETDYVKPMFTIRFKDGQDKENATQFTCKTMDSAAEELADFWMEFCEQYDYEGVAPVSLLIEDDDANDVE